jgi:hypothetical protein
VRVRLLPRIPVSPAEVLSTGLLTALTTLLLLAPMVLKEGFGKHMLMVVAMIRVRGEVKEGKKFYRVQ